MFNLLSRSTESCIGLKVEGKLRAQDYDSLQPILENAFKAYGTINLVLEMEEFEGFKDIDAILKDVEMGIERFGQFGRVAVVSDEGWQEIATKLLDPLALKTDIEFFATDKRDKAWTWTCGESWKQ
jgi:hypothetical protein